MLVRMENILENELSEDREQVLKQATIKFGRRVKQLRQNAGLTQKELADRLTQWGRSFHQTTVAKLEAGTRPTTMEELIPLSVALGVSQKAFFDEPSPADRAEHKVREAEQRLLKLRAEANAMQARYLELQDELRGAVEDYSQQVEALRELDPEAAAGRTKVVDDLSHMVSELEGSDRAADDEEDANAIEDLAQTWKEDRWPL